MERILEHLNGSIRQLNGFTEAKTLKRFQLPYWPLALLNDEVLWGILTRAILRVSLPVRAWGTLVNIPHNTSFEWGIVSDINFRVFLTVLPTVYVPHQLVGVPLGQDVTIECYIEAWPAGLNYWKRPNGIEVLHSDDKLVKHCSFSTT